MATGQARQRYIDDMARRRGYVPGHQWPMASCTIRTTTRIIAMAR
jgi:hypothetical protein